MITIKYIPGKITVAGHAGYNPGNDIVCAAVSTLTNNLIYSILDLTETPLKCDIKAGDTIIEYKTEELTKEAELLINSFFIGLNGVMGSFPDYVRVEI